MKCKVATKADVEVVVAGTIDVVRSCARRVAEDEVRSSHECTVVYEKRRARCRVEISTRDSVAPAAVNASWTSEGGIISRHAGARRR